MDNIRESGFANASQQISSSWQFECHVYSLAIFWFAVALYSFIVALNLRPLAPCKGLLCRICVLLCTAGILRAVFLILDPYETKHRVSVWISRVLYILPWPIFTASFIFAFIALLHLTKININPYILQNVKLLSIIMLTFSVILATFEIINQYYIVVQPCHTLAVSLFAFWTLIVCSAYSGYGWLMLRSLSSAGDPTALRYYKRRKNKGPKNNAGAVSLEPPKIRITDENECSYSYRSETASPVLSETSDPSDSAEEQRDVENKDGDMGDNSLKNNKQKSWLGNKKSQKSRKKKKRSKSRSSRLRFLIKALFVPTLLCLLTSAWLVAEVYYVFYMQNVNKWEWFTVVSLSRLTEVLFAILLALATRCGFNKL